MVLSLREKHADVTRNTVKEHPDTVDNSNDNVLDTIDALIMTIRLIHNDPDD